MDVMNCPFCQSEKTKKSDTRQSFGNMSADGSYTKPTLPLFICNNCGKYFDDADFSGKP